MRTRLKFWAGDVFGYLDEVSALRRKCTTKAREADKARRKGKDDTTSAMWTERAARLGLIIASQLVDMRVCFIAHSYYPSCL